MGFDVDRSNFKVVCQSCGKEGTIDLYNGDPPFILLLDQIEYDTGKQWFGYFLCEKCYRKFYC